MEKTRDDRLDELTEKIEKMCEAEGFPILVAAFDTGGEHAFTTLRKPASQDEAECIMQSVGMIMLQIAQRFPTTPFWCHPACAWIEIMRAALLRFKAEEPEAHAIMVAQLADMFEDAESEAASTPVRH